MKKENIDYFFEIFEKNNIPGVFPKILDLGKEEPIKNPDYEASLHNSRDTVYSVFFIPDYLKPQLESDDGFAIRKINQFFKGYAIFLEGFDSADAYIKSRFRSNAKGIRRRVKRLETCFTITYKTYYGSIKEGEYTFLMDCLEKMLIRRFEQRNDVSQSLLRWDHYKNLYFSLINEKKASLFVILDNEKPIMVSLNHHFHGRLFSAISSYDIDYAKFSLGSVEIYKKLEWLIENKHTSYEMGMGDLSYKREWCNHIYHFEQQVIYPKGSFLGTITATIVYTKAWLKEFVFKLAYVRYKKYKAKKKKNNNSRDKEVVYRVESIEVAKNEEHDKKIDYNHPEYAFLRRPVFDFLYTAIEHVSDISVQEISASEKIYLIKGKKKMQRVICTPILGSEV